MSFAASHRICIWVGVLLLSAAMIFAAVSVADRLRMTTLRDDVAAEAREKRDAWRQLRELETKHEAVRDVCQDAISRGVPFDGRAP